MVNVINQALDFLRQKYGNYEQNLINQAAQAYPGLPNQASHTTWWGQKENYNPQLMQLAKDQSTNMAMYFGPSSLENVSTSITPQGLSQAIKPLEGLPGLGDRILLKLNKYGKELFHETSPANAENILKKTASDAGGRYEINVANSPDLAIGQGGKGVKLTFDANKAYGTFRDQLKPSADFLHQQGLTDELMINQFEPDVVKSIEIPKDLYNQPGGITASALNTAGLNFRNPQILKNGNFLFTRSSK